MIKGESIVTMMLMTGCNNRDHAINMIAHEIGKTTLQVERLIETDAFTPDEIEKLCDKCGYVVALVPKSAFKQVPIA